MTSILFLHGAIGSKEQLQSIMDSISKNYKVYSINFSGHGGEQIPEEKFSIELFANDVLSWMNHNNISYIDIFGYSMGGYVALYLARKFPNRVRKVFTLATKFNWNYEVASRESKMLDPKTIATKVPQFAKVLEERHSLENWKIVLNKTAEMMIDLGNKNSLTKEDLSKIENKILLSVGDKDQMVTLEETIDVFRILKNAALLVLPETQHPIEKVSIERLSFELNRFFGEE